MGEEESSEAVELIWTSTLKARGVLWVVDTGRDGRKGTWTNQGIADYLAQPS